MRSDYLWDKSGEPDPEVERLERLLSGFSHQKPWTEPRPASRARSFAAAASIVAVFSSALWLIPLQPKTTWALATTDASGRERGGKIAVGDWLETGGGTAKVEVGDIGELQVGSNTRLRIVRSAKEEKRVALERGEIEAFIWAPPGQFFVNTPAATAVDLGCKYTLKVDPSGEGLLKVEMGWVAFEAQGRESFIPAGAACRTRPVAGPGIPYYLDASEALRSAVTRFEDTHAQEAINTVLAEARPKDAVTLWHLIKQVDASTRTAVYTRMAALVSPPPGVTEPGILALKQDMLDAWWNELGLDDVNWWRKWKGKW
jgi:ferric-dicitrate binding protein FerR (iron transport regulator)